jgi:uncharacterized protein
MRLLPATRGIVLAFLALGLAALLNAQGLRKRAEIQPQGFGRDVALAFTRPLVHVSSALYLDRPRHALQVAIGRRDQDRIDTRVAFRLPPPAGPLPHPAPERPTAKKHAPKHPRKRLSFDPARPLRVWVAGDSLVQVPGESLERATGARGAIEILGIESRLATGLGQPGVYNWFTRIADAISELRPNAAVLSFGADDGHDYLGGVPAGRKIGKLGTPSWNAEYRRRLDGVTRELNAAGIYVVWIGLPIPAGPGFRRSFAVINKLLRSVAEAHPTGSTYVDTWHMLDSKQGGYAEYLRNASGRLVLMRARDGVHYQPAAGDLIARTILQRLNGVYDLTSWRRSPAGSGAAS